MKNAEIRSKDIFVNVIYEQSFSPEENKKNKKILLAKLI